MRRRSVNDRTIGPEQVSSSEKNRPLVKAVFRRPHSGAETGVLARRLRKEFMCLDGLLLPRLLSLFVNAECVLCERLLAGIAGEEWAAGDSGVGAAQGSN